MSIKIQFAMTNGRPDRATARGIDGSRQLTTEELDFVFRDILPPTLRRSKSKITCEILKEESDAGSY
jgi:hypothetical protein